MKAIGCRRASGKFMGAIFLRELRCVNTAVSLGSAVTASSGVLSSHHSSLRAEQVERLLSALLVLDVEQFGFFYLHARPCLWRNLCLEQDHS